MASLSVSGKYAIITGGSSGINLAFARLLLEHGCSVLIGDLSFRPELEQLLKEYPHPPSSSSKPSALFQPTDVRSWPQLGALFEAAESQFPQIDIVVPGAGIFEPQWSSFWHPPQTASNPDTASRDAADGKDVNTYATLDVNLTHPIRLSQLAIGYWTRRRLPGCLVHVSSLAGQSASIGTPIYYASKHGLNGFVRALGCLRDELGIRVGAVAPGAVDTPMWSEDEQKAAMLKGQDNELLDPKEIARGMLELCENPEYGDGTILEVTLAPRRVVPLYNADPPKVKGSKVPGFHAAEHDLVRELKEKGLRT